MNQAYAVDFGIASNLQISETDAMELIGFAIIV
jgi:hypothetical protein